MATSDETTPEKKARAIVAAIIDDMTDRGGFSPVWDAIDRDTREEIKREWEQIAFEKIVGL